MIHLNATTAKTDLMKILESESGYKEDLYLIIDSLPTFLNTPIAFTVFNYQISRYPRKILWWSWESQILEFLKNCSATLSNPVINSAKTAKVNLPTTYSTNTQIQINNPVNSDFNTLANPSIIAKEQKTKPTFSAQDILTQGVYEPINLIQDENNQENSFLGVQNFDAWIEKIEATKTALSSLQNNEFANNKRQNLEVIKQKSSRVFKILTLSLVLSLIFTLSIIILPAKVYTIELTSVSEEAGISVDIKLEDFSKSVINLTSEEEIQPRGKQELLTELSTGEVTLINEGSREVDLDNGLFRLVADEKYYQVLPNNTLPKSFSIPPKSQSTQVLKFKIQATKTGSEYNLPSNTRLDIVNLQGGGKKVCFSCYAITSTDIKNTEIGGQSVVTEYDQAFITQSIESKLAEKRNEAIQNIQRSKVFANEEWYKNIDSKYIFNKNLNEPADLLKLDATVMTEIYYLTQSQIEELIKKQNGKIKSFTEIAITDIQNNPRNSDTLKIGFFFTYTTENSCQDKQKFLYTLSSTDFEDAKKKILVECPGVSNIEKKDIGINMPGVPARVDLNLTNT